jgi:beta-glucosidase/6-phospho-beta-glucosidase/beta-galactosidase
MDFEGGEKLESNMFFLTEDPSRSEIPLTWQLEDFVGNRSIVHFSEYVNYVLNFFKDKVSKRTDTTEQSERKHERAFGQSIPLGS